MLTDFTFSSPLILVSGHSGLERAGVHEGSSREDSRNPRVPFLDFTLH